MKAVRIPQPGPPEVLRYEDVPEPRLAPGQVTLEVRAVSVNHLDLWVRRGLPGVRYPVIPGADAAGVVRETGKRVLLNPSSSCGRCEFCAGGDSSMCREFAVLGEHGDGTDRALLAVDPSRLVELPDGFGFEEAAAAPLVFLTAWRMMITRGRLRPSEDVLVWSAGAGVGTACLQLAKAAGARVVATASSDAKCERLSGLGADLAINHAREDVVSRVRELTGKRGVDMVVDYVGKDTWVKSLQCLRRGGRLVTCGATSGHDPVEDLRHVFYRQIEVIGSTMGNDRELRDVLRLVFQGRVKPVIDAVLPMKDAAEAHRRLEGRRVFGKIVLVP
jgi:NADPH:quinone reductase-like Zn-dependent oxidoreductase